VVRPRRIVFVCKGLEDPATRYRILQYEALFIRHGWQISCLAERGSWFERLAVLKAAKTAEVLVVSRRTYSYPFLWLLRYFAGYLIFDFDDAIFCKSSGAVSRRRQKGFARMVSCCDQIWAGNRYLAAAAEPYQRRVRVIPTSVFPEAYEKIKVDRSDSFVDLVWIGSRSTRKHLLTIMPVLEETALAVPGLRLKIIADFSLSAQHLDVLAVPWSKAHEAYDLVSADIGLAPLPDNPFTRGKCALKIIQYMAAGLPVVSSASGVNREVVADGVSGFLAHNPEQWQAAIVRLARNRKMRRAMGEAGREIFLKNYSGPVVFAKIMGSLESDFSPEQS